MNEEYNNPFRIVNKMKEEFEKRNIEITNIQHDDYFGGSWIIEFILGKLNYRFVWDNRENWLVLVFLGKNKNHQKDWEDIDIYRYNKTSRTLKEKEALEDFVIKNIIASLDKLKQTSQDT
jgi:hypothetical protein